MALWHIHLYNWAIYVSSTIRGTQSPRMYANVTLTTVNSTLALINILTLINTYVLKSFDYDKKIWINISLLVEDILSKSWEKCSSTALISGRSSFRERHKLRIEVFQKLYIIEIIIKWLIKNIN